mgnify:FL=1
MGMPPRPYWTQRCDKQFVNRTITAVRYMTMTEARGYGFKVAPLVISLDDGTDFFSIIDHEGSDGGELLTVKGGKYITIPAMWSEQ